MSGSIPHANITAGGPMTRGDLLMLLYWFADTLAVPETRGIRGLSRLTRLAVILGHETGLDREIDPWFPFHVTPSGGVVSPALWAELLALREYQVVIPVPALEEMPREEVVERMWMLENLIPPHERGDYPMPRDLERDLLTNKGTFFAAKREDQLIARRIATFKTVPDLERLSIAELNERALPLVRTAATAAAAAR
ncbi:MAG TPA: hypothetical protein VFP58_13210 [Candidatus Eisenbacteria bacterium]|nr:hypothetical protein [Candidatus Eisenbacteria bacterium]